jgi:hypothetical protein
VIGVDTVQGGLPAPHGAAQPGGQSHGAGADERPGPESDGPELCSAVPQPLQHEPHWSSKLARWSTWHWLAAQGIALDGMASIKAAHAATACLTLSYMPFSHPCPPALVRASQECSSQKGGFPGRGRKLR